ncbi:hypothetical protein [Lentzea sp. NBRC 105346]|uniref:hypothetical protein n=1 Tax=Lentzea sp. NBRC 105346 TaxID=3032205 RepID=UPI002556A24C|nr:hypothetical protein [Lentzea sp. NBRC 105346]
MQTNITGETVHYISEVSPREGDILTELVPAALRFPAIQEAATANLEFQLTLKQ